MIRLLCHAPVLANRGVSRPGRLSGLVIAGVLMAGLGAAGCGSGSSSTTTSTQNTAITKAEFLAQANAICAKADPVLSVAGAKLASHPTGDQVVSIVKGTYLPSIEAQIAGIRALGAPAGEQAKVMSMLKLVEADLSRLRSTPPLVATDVFADFARVAHPYGLTACAPLS